MLFVYSIIIIFNSRFLLDCGNVIIVIIILLQNLFVYYLFIIVFLSFNETDQVSFLSGILIVISSSFSQEVDLHRILRTTVVRFKATFSKVGIHILNRTSTLAVIIQTSR